MKIMTSKKIIKREREPDYNRILKDIIEIIELYGKPIIIEQRRKPIKKNKKKARLRRPK